jgi:hypothetical protein
MKHKLEFLNPTFHKGLNVTVRLGNKWYKNAHVQDEIQICRADSNMPLAEGVIVGLKYVNFKEITIRDLLNEHDPECRTPGGLAFAMMGAYDEFSLDDDVTVIEFEIQKVS